jgi:hypothetical protein
MLAYQLMPAVHAIDDLRKRRLKVSFLDDMNDPFELLSPRLERAAHRIAFGKWRQDVNKRTRVLCFSKAWFNPVLWSHYADKHRGICLGFEIPDDCALEVQYESARLELQIEHQLQRHGTIGEDIVNRLLTTKYVDWAYEARRDISGTWTALLPLRQSSATPEDGGRREIIGDSWRS